MDFKFIPELYYDFIARVLPGAFLLFLGISFLDLLNLSDYKELSPVLIIVVGVIFAHYTSIILHEIWMWLCLIPKLKRDEFRKSVIASKISDLKSGVAGDEYKLNRLMRGAAEIDAAESLFVGFLVLIVMSLITQLYVESLAFLTGAILFLFWRNSLISASETLVNLDA